MAFEQVANNPVTTLSAAITSTGATSLTVASATGFSAAANYRIIVDQEIMLVTAGAGTTTWTVTRGAEGTAAVTHANGAAVTQILTAAALLQLFIDAITRDAFANLPANQRAGKLFLPTDSHKARYDDGSAWHSHGPFLTLTDPPLAAAWATWVNQLSTTLTDTPPGLVLINTGGMGASESLSGAFKAIPATPYTITAHFYAMLQQINYNAVGLCLRNSGSGGLKTWMARAGASMKTFNVRYLTGPTAFSSEPYNTTFDWGRDFWLRIVDDGTTRRFKYSGDGVNFLELYNETHAQDFTPDEIGLALWSVTAGANHYVTIDSYLETSP